MGEQGKRDDNSSKSECNLIGTSHNLNDCNLVRKHINFPVKDTNIAQVKF